MKKILLALLLLSGCSSRPITPIPTPSYERMGLIKGQVESKSRAIEVNGVSERFALAYLEALKAASLGDKNKACSLFEDLADSRDFSLNQTALVHTLENCSLSERELKKIWKNTTIANYLKENYFENSLKLAEKFGMEEFIADFSYELSFFRQVQSEKVKLLNSAVTIAQKLNLAIEEEKYFNRLVEVSPQYSKEITKENIYRVARDLESSRQFDRARDLYLDIINSDEHMLEEKIKAYNSYRISFKVARNLSTFLEKTGEMELFLRQLLEQDPEDSKLQEAWVDAKINYARAVWTEHMNQEARTILEDILERKIGTPAQLATVYWVYGSLHIESKENSEALQKFEKAATFKIPSADQQENIQWAIVWNKYLVKRYSDVISDIDKFTKKSINPNFIHKLNFWKGRALLKLGKTTEAKEVFAATAVNDMFGFYGLVAAMEIKLPLEPIPASVLNTDPIGNIVLDWLIAVDEKKLSVKVLKEINSQFKTLAERERAMSLYALSGWYQGGMVQIYNFPINKRDELTKKHISVVFPTPYESIFSKHAKKYKIPESLTYAIARQESAFNTNVRSWADAFGLMQLIPEKAVELSRKYKIPYKDFNDLYNPDPNVEMGSALLAELKKSFKGKFAQSVAAYNASTSAISVWEKERFSGDYLEFIEMIPYEETRNYIKLVFRNYITYQRTLKNERIVIPFDFFNMPFI